MGKQMNRDIITLTERHTHRISLKTFHLLPYQELRIKWEAFSSKTKENIFEYFLYLRNLAEIHDSDNYDNWNYWQDIFSDFISGFDEEHPYYDGNFEKVVLREERDKDALAKQ